MSAIAITENNVPEEFDESLQDMNKEISELCTIYGAMDIVKKVFNMHLIPRMTFGYNLRAGFSSLTRLL